jgi:hypothetical protein
MLHAMVTSMAMLVVAQAQADVKTEKASDARGLLRPSEIRLDFQDRTLAEIVDGINAQAPGSVAIRPGRTNRFSGQEPAPRRFSIREAIDRVGRATQTRPNSEGSSIRLVPASPDRGFAYNDGAFRVIVRGTSYSSAYQFAPHFFLIREHGLEQPRRDGSSRRPVLFAQLTVTAEPRLKVHGPVELVVVEAVDERGRTLLDVIPWRQSLKNPQKRFTGFPNEEHLTMSLKALDDPGKRIKRLRGSVSLEVSAPAPGSPRTVAEVSFDFTDIPMP